MVKAEGDVVTCVAPVNIALIKYWGKRDEALILPVNPSLSVTLNVRDLRTTTSAVVVDSQGEADVRMWLNGEELDLAANERIRRVIEEMRTMAGKSNCGLRIASENNFPTAAGLASSAAGLACLVFTLAKLFELREDFPGQLSSIARRGSGSACRSLYGGFVRWNAGLRDDGQDSLAEQVLGEGQWPELRILICVVDDRKKETSSTRGMRNSVASSELLSFRAASVVPKRMEAIEQAIKERDFETVAKITMRDSNQFHAVCLDTDPPIFYLNQTSKAIIAAVERLNSKTGAIRAAYTFDAGPNAVLLSLEKDYDELLSLVTHCFPPMEAASKVDPNSSAIIGSDFRPPPLSPVGEEIYSHIGIQDKQIRYYIRTDVGPGPSVDATTLLDKDSLVPIRAAS